MKHLITLHGQVYRIVNISVRESTFKIFCTRRGIHVLWNIFCGYEVKRDAFQRVRSSWIRLQTLNDINDIGSKSFIRVKIVHSVDRSELFELLEEKLWRVSIAAYRYREFYGGYSELTVSMSVSVRIDGLGKVRKQLIL